MRRSGNAILIIFLMASVLCSCGKGKNSQAPTVDSTAWILKAAATSKLYTAEYRVHKIVTHDDVVRLQGTFFEKQFNLRLPLGDRKIAIPMDATLKAYIDFSGFSSANVHKNGKTIEVTLPDPQVVVTSSQIDHEATKEYVSFLRSNYSDAEMADYTQQGLACIVQHVPEMGIFETARESATRILVPLICSMGYKEQDVVIHYRKAFTAEDMLRMVDFKNVGK